MAHNNYNQQIALENNPFGQLSEPKFNMQQSANRPNSTYDVYDNYLNDSKRPHSGVNGIGLGLINGVFDDSDDEDEPPSAMRKPTIGSAQPAGSSPSFPTHSYSHPLSPPITRWVGGPIPIAAPRPGYAAPVDALNTLVRPSPSVSPQVRHTPIQMSQIEHGVPPLSIRPPPLSTPSPFMIPSMPSTPHPLQPPMSPITPALARPPKAAEIREVKFVAGQQTILRGNSEETLLPKRGDRGDDFWRRFSYVAKNEGKKRYEQSSWLKKTQTNSSQMSRWIWIIGIVLLIIIGGAVGIGFYLSHNSTSNSPPEAIGGSANDGSTPPPQINTPIPTPTSSKHVSPTNTVARRYYDAAETPSSSVSKQFLPKLHFSYKHRPRVE